MAGEVWQQRRKKHRANLADWCDTNLPPKYALRVAALVSKKEAAPRLVGILQTYRGRNNGVLDSAQRHGPPAGRQSQATP